MADALSRISATRSSPVSKSCGELADIYFSNCLSSSPGLPKAIKMSSSLVTVSAVLVATLEVSIFNSAYPVSPVLATVSVKFCISSLVSTEPKPFDTAAMLSSATRALSEEYMPSDAPCFCISNSFS